MPIYAYKCDKCDTQFDRFLKMAKYDDPQECPECGASPCAHQVTAVNFNLTGDGWASKNGRIAGQMSRKNSGLRERRDTIRREQPEVRLVPNVDGVETGTWAEAQKYAESKGKNPVSYDEKVQSEKAGYK